MPDHEFTFALYLCENVRFDEMLREVTARVLGQVGCPPTVATELSDRLIAGLADGRAAGVRCDVQFCARAGEIEITLSVGGRRVVRTLHRLS